MELEEIEIKPFPFAKFGLGIALIILLISQAKGKK